MDDQKRWFLARVVGGGEDNPHHLMGFVQLTDKVLDDLSKKCRRFQNLKARYSDLETMSYYFYPTVVERALLDDGHENLDDKLFEGPVILNDLPFDPEGVDHTRIECGHLELLAWGKDVRIFWSFYPKHWDVRMELDGTSLEFMKQEPVFQYQVTYDSEEASHG